MDDKITIEPNHEYEISEIKYDGEEIYKEPLSQSDNLALLISKIDFNEDLNISYTSTATATTAENKEQIKNSTKLAQKFHRNILSKVKQSYDEICVLLDCLKIAHSNQNLLGLENGRDDERTEHVSEKALTVVLKRKNIEASKALIKKALDKIYLDADFNNNRFHSELYRIRQYWRIKKIANRFIIDAGYRAVGCLNALKANFEIFKNDFNKEKLIEVLTPEEFEEDAFIRVQIISNDDTTNPVSVDYKYSIFQQLPINLNDPSITNSQWYYTLEHSQQSIYAKELFNQILKEAFSFELQSQLKPLVIGNSIRIQLSTNAYLIISLVHQSDENTLTDTKQVNKNILFKSYENSLLEHFLHQLLRKYFQQNFSHIDQRPITAMVPYNARFKLAGITYSKDSSSYLNIRKMSILPSIKNIAEHLITKNRVLKLLNEVSKEVGEPIVYVEPFLVNSATTTDIRVIIMSSSYEFISKYTYYVKLRNTKITVVTPQNTITFTDNIDNLKPYFKDQCCLHQINCIETLMRIFDWQLITNNKIKTSFCLCSVLLMWHSVYAKKIAIKLGPVNNIEIYLNKYELPKELNNTIIDNYGTETNLDWVIIENDYTKVDIDSYPGRTLINKIELFLASLC